MSYKIGRIGEEKAKNFLKEIGFVILEANYHSRFGEIDIIAQKDDVLHFVEVKYSQGSFEPINNITSKKLKKIVLTIDTYNKNNLSYQLDIILIKKSEIEFLENVTFDL